MVCSLVKGLLGVEGLILGMLYRCVGATKPSFRFLC